MNSGFRWRLLPALAGAVAITLAVFWFMQGLIEAGEQEDLQVAVFREVQVLRPEPEEPEPEEAQDSEPEAVQEPQMEALAVAPSAPQPATVPAAPQPELAVTDIALPEAGERWSAPLGSGAVGIDSGQDASGFVEVVPYDTRRPNVPEVAWRNRIDGWVLVAFSVTPEGRTRDVRVLDAQPRGVFEEKVIAAVRDWQYQVNFSGKRRDDVVLTQRVEVNWKNYPYNLPHVD
jgi:periplasmic protein TonB